MTNCTVSRQLFVNNILSQTVNSGGVLTSMAKDYVEEAPFTNNRQGI